MKTLLTDKKGKPRLEVGTVPKSDGGEYQVLVIHLPGKVKTFMTVEYFRELQAAIDAHALEVACDA